MKTIFCGKKIFLCFGDIHFSNACAIQVNLGTDELLEKTVVEDMCYWQKETEIEKKALKYH